MEVYKQFEFATDYNESTDTVTWSYTWYQFPFQFCSTPMYIGLLAALCWKFRFRYGFLCFLGTYGLFGGVAVYLYPVTIFVTTALINNQSMTHHGLMILMGVVVLIFFVEKSHKSILYGLPIFLVLIVIAEILNVIVCYTVGNDVEYNMFYISPYQISNIPIAKQLQTWTKYSLPLVLFLYITIFTFLGYLMLLIAIITDRIITYVKKQCEKKKNKTRMKEPNIFDPMISNDEFNEFKDNTGE